MPRALFFFLLAALLSIGTFFPKSKHLFDFHLVFPVGLYFILALLLAFRPNVSLRQQWQFAGLSMLVWLALFLASYNVLFMLVVPIAGGLGAWLIVVLCNKCLELSIHRPGPIIWTGVATVLLGLGFMILLKNQVSIGLKAGVLTGLWQSGVGGMLARAVFQKTART